MDMMLDYIFSPTLALLVVTTYLVYFWYTTKRPVGLPPGPWSVPIVGGFIAVGQNMDCLPQTFTDIARKYGNIFSMQRPCGRWMVVLNDAQSFREAFLKKGIAFAGRPDKHFPTILKIQNPLHPVQGIIWGDFCDEWKRQRTLSLTILRSLGFGRRGIENKICEETTHVIAEIEKLKGQPFNPHRIINNAVANIICSLLFGERYEYDDNDFAQIQSSLDTFFEMTVRAAVADTFWFAKYLPSVQDNLHELQKAVGIFNAICHKKLEARNGSSNNSDDFVGLYLKEIKDNTNLQDRTFQLIQDFFSAGLETTAVTLMWALCFMAKYQDVQEKIKLEIFENIGRDKRLTLEDRAKLPYTQATLSEILRLSTTSPFTAPHETTCDTELLGYNIPKGTEVWGNQWAVVRDPVVFPDPNELKPERFLDENGNVVKNENLIQFGLGTRSCLGEQLAKQELFLFFSHMVQKFHIYSPAGLNMPAPFGKYAITHKCPDYKICASVRR